MGAQVPLWVTILLVVIVAVGNIVVALINQYVVRQNALTQDRTAQKALEDAQMKADRDADAELTARNHGLLLLALELQRKGDPMSAHQALCILLTLKSTKGVAPEDLAIVFSVTRPPMGGILEQARQAELDGHAEFDPAQDDREDDDDEEEEAL